MVTENNGTDRPGSGFDWQSVAAAEPFYLATAALNQRLDLLQHLTANSDRLVLVKGSDGIGKTAMLRRFQSLAADHWQLCRIDANPMMQPEQLFASLAGCFDLASVEGRLAERLTQQFAAMRQAGRQPVVLVDDAQLLPAASLISLFRLHELRTGAQALVRVILFATPQIDDLLATPQVMAMNPHSLQVMDLPSLTAEQSAQLSRRLAGQTAVGNRLSDSQLAKIYQDTQGIPGEIVKRIDRLRNRLQRTPAGAGTRHGSRWLRLVWGAVIGVPLLLALIFQDRINALFTGAGQQQQSASSPSVTRDRSVPLRLPEQPPQPAPIKQSPVEQNQTGIRPRLSLPEVAQREEAVVAGDSGEQPEAEPVRPPIPVAGPESTPLPTEAGPITDAAPIEVSHEPAIATAAKGAAQQAASPSLNLPPAHPAPESVLPLPKPPAAVLTQTPPPEAGSSEQSTTGVTGSSASAPLSTAADSTPPVVDRTVSIQEPPPAVKAETSAPAVNPPAKAAAVADGTASDRDYKTADWLLRQRPTDFTLQLLGVQDEAAARRFLRAQPLREDMAYFRTLRKDRPWFVVVYGVYPGRAEALAARSGLPGELAGEGVWPRSLASVQAAIRVQE